VKSSTFELGLIVRHKDKTLNQTLIVKTSMGPSSLVRKKRKYKLSELRKKIGKLTAEGTVKGGEGGSQGSTASASPFIPPPGLPLSLLSSHYLLFFHTKEPSSRLVVQTGRLSKYPTSPPPKNRSSGVRWGEH